MYTDPFEVLSKYSHLPPSEFLSREKADGSKLHPNPGDYERAEWLWNNRPWYARYSNSFGFHLILALIFAIIASIAVWVVLPPVLPIVKEHPVMAIFVLYVAGVLTFNWILQRESLWRSSYQAALLRLAKE